MLVRECYTETVDGQTVHKERWIEMPGVVDEAAGIVLMQAEQQLEKNRLTIEQQADLAITANKQIIADGNAWLAANPSGTLTAAQLSAAMRQTVQASIKAAQQRNGVIRLLRGKFDATD